MNGSFSVGPIGQLMTDPLRFLILVAGFLFGMVLHNVVQARLAKRFGDSTAQTRGFSSVDPQVHFDLFGLLWYFIVGFCIPQSIPLNRVWLRSRTQAAWIWLSGPVTLWVWALVLLLLEHILGSLLPGLQIVNVTQMGLQAAAFSLVYHGVVFLVPLPGLDGGQALYAVGNFKTRETLDRIQAAGPLVIFIFFIVLSFSGILGLLARPVLSVMQSIIGLIPF